MNFSDDLCELIFLSLHKNEYDFYEASLNATS